MITKSENFKTPSQELANLVAFKMLVDAFSKRIMLKFEKSMVDKGRYGWDDESSVSTEELKRMLIEHVEKGDMRDVGVLAVMIWNREGSLNG